MNFFGIGTDILSIDRIQRSLKNKNFVKRIFNEKEILKCKRVNKSINCYAKRFAAKEAFSKALGTGVSNGLNFNEIVILNKKTATHICVVPWVMRAEECFGMSCRVLLAGPWD